MKIPRVKLAAAFAASALLLGGCGEAPYELTDQENAIIVNYAAHIAMKYDLNQKEGLQFVWPEPEEELLPEVSDTEEIGAEEDDGTLSAGGAVDGGTSDSMQTGLQELFGTDAVSVAYTGAELMSSYVESSYYAMNADAGKQYLVLTISIANQSDTEVELDNLERMPQFRINLADGKEIPGELTVLTEDFATYQGKLAAGETVDTVLLFMVPDTVSNPEDFTLSVSLDGNNYQIIL